MVSIAGNVIELYSTKYYSSHTYYTCYTCMSIIHVTRPKLSPYFYGNKSFLFLLLHTLQKYFKQEYKIAVCYGEKMKFIQSKRLSEKQNVCRKKCNH